MVVIGAGLAGLSAALRLATAGRFVIVVEAQSEIGGCCSTVRCDGDTLNNGAIYLAVPSLVRTAFAQLGLDFDAEVDSARIAAPQLTFTDRGARIFLDRAETSRIDGDNASARTSQLRRGLETLQHDWGPIYRTLVGDVLPYAASPARMIRALWRHLPRLGGRVDRLIASYFADEDLRAAVASTLLYTGLAPDKLPAVQIVGLLALLEEGFHLPHGGMGDIPRALAAALRRASVPVVLGKRVTGILVGDGRVRGVALDDGSEIAASEVVATCAGFDVVRRLLRGRDVPRKLASTARKAPLSHRAISIQMRCSGVALPDAFLVHHAPPMDRQGLLHRPAPGIPRWFSYTQSTRVHAGLASGDHAVVEMYAPAPELRSVEAWREDITAESVDAYVGAFKARSPGLQVEVLRVLDPLEFATQRHLYEGALYGIAPGCPPWRMFPHRSGIPGLYLAGQTTSPGFGVAPAMLSGIQAAERLMEGR